MFPPQVRARAAAAALFVLSVGSLVASTAGCADRGKKSQEGATKDAAWLVSLVDRDVAEVERGLPEGAKRIAAQLGKEQDVRQNPATVRTALLKVRQQVPDLGVAKSTFFAFTDDKGIAVRNDLEQDTMAGKDVVGAYPALRKALEGGTFVSTLGRFPGAPNPIGPDKEWVAAVPVKRDDGSTAGLLVTGWTYRRFAFHLQESLKRELQDQILRGGDTGKLPVVYVLLFDKEGAYGPRGVPPVNEKMLGELDLVTKTASGSASGVLEITERAFGWGAARLPRLGEDIGVVVLRSEI